MEGEWEKKIGLSSSSQYIIVLLYKLPIIIRYTVINKRK
jgi:hypothetical protein